jgi:drug/metabolite transporter (DMT)-like permease
MFNTRQKSYFSLFIICFVWGTTWVISKMVVKEISFVQLCGMRLTTAGFLMVTFFTAKGFGLPKRKDWPRLLLMSLLMFVMANGLSTWGITYIESGLGAIIGSTTAFWIPLFVLWLTRKNVFNTKVILGLGAGILGVIIIFSEKLGQVHGKNFLWGIALSLTACIAWSLATVLSIKKKESARLYVETSWQMLLAGLFFLPLAFILNEWTSPGLISSKTWLAMIYLTFAGSILTFMSYVYAIKHLPPALLSIYPYINPIIAVLFGWLLLKEPVSTTLAIGSAITLTGVYLVNEGSKKKVGEG